MFKTIMRYPFKIIKTWHIWDSGRKAAVNLKDIPFLGKIWKVEEYVLNEAL